MSSSNPLGRRYGATAEISESRARRMRRRRLTRALPAGVLLAVVAIAALVVGIQLASASGHSERRLAARYTRDWARDDFAGMYALLSPASRRTISEATFSRALAGDADTATATGITPLRVLSVSGGTVRILVRVQTRVFGVLREVLQVPFDGSGRADAIRYSPALLFPGLTPGERLSRTDELGPRGTLLADNGAVLATGPAQTPGAGVNPSVAGEIVGTLESIPAGSRARYTAEGYPPGARVGQDGLERIFQARLAGQIGGTLRAGRRVLASRPAGHGQTVRTTINPAMESTAIAALGGQYAGMTVMDPRTGALLGLAGIAFNAVQPPGSTMKIVTATAVIEHGLATDTTSYPYATEATIDGYTLQNASGESCGGTLTNSFATSCNSVFAPLGARLGGPRLVATAEAFGFNHPTGIAGATESTIPSAATIGDALAVGSSAIGQGKVQASTLEMADIAATIAMRGRRPLPTLLKSEAPRFVTVTTHAVAAQVQHMMLAVVQYGTGVTAQIPGVEVAGKTGTAELATTGNQANATKETDAWFVAYAPANHPEVVACALFPSAGYGEDTAAPAVKQVLEAALAAHL